MLAISMLALHMVRFEPPSIAATPYTTPESGAYSFASFAKAIDSARSLSIDAILTLPKAAWKQED